MQDVHSSAVMRDNELGQIAAFYAIWLPSSLLLQALRLCKEQGKHSWKTTHPGVPEISQSKEYVLVFPGTLCRDECS